MKKLTLIFLGSLVTIYSCKKNNDITTTNNNTPPNEIIHNNAISKLDLTNVKLLFSKVVNTSNSEKKILYTITNDNKINTMNYYNNKGGFLTYSPEIEIMHDINDKWLYIAFYNYYYYDSLVGTDGHLYAEFKTLENQRYIINKATGNAYSFANIGTPSKSGGYTSELGKAAVFKFDLIGNMYFIKNENEYIYKVDISNPDRLTATQVFSEQVSKFIMNKDGDIIYETKGNDIRMKGKNNNNLKQLDKNSSYWQAYDGSFYTDIYWMENSGGKQGVGKLNSNGVITDTVEFVNNRTDLKVNVNAIDNVFNINNKTYVTQYAYIHEVYNNTSQPKGEVVVSSSDWKQIIDSKNYLFIANSNNEIYVFDPTSNKSTLVFSGYSVYGMVGLSVKNNDDIIVNGLRMSDSKKVIFTMDQSGNMKVIDESSNIEMDLIISLN